MFHSENDTSAKPNFDNFESLAERRKLRPVMKSKNICFKRSRGQLHINNLSNSTTPHLSSPGVGSNDPLEDPELKLALMNLIPRNTAQETSEGVQELIKHVSDFFGKKNPFRDGSKSSRREKNETVRPSSRHSIRSHSSRDTLRSIRKPKTTDGERKVNKGAQSSAGSSRDTVVSPKSESKSKSLSYGNRRRLQFRKHVQPESKCEPIEENDVKAKSVRNSSPRDNPEKNSPHTEKRADKEGCRTQPAIPGRSATPKKLKPSEIPLRKNRTNVSKVKQESNAAKPVKEVNTTPLGQVNSNRKPGAHINRETPPSTRGINKENLESSRNSSKDKFKTTEKDVADCDDDNSGDIHPSSSTKTSNIPDLSIHSPKARLLDLEQVRSSTFTVMTTLTSTLHRLESIHQQTIGLKENKSERILVSKSSKLKLLTPKSSFNLLKVKGSKKNLSARLSSKGNKPCLKNKRKKSKTEVKTSRTLTFQESTKPGSIESSRGVKKATKPVSTISNLPTSKNRNVEREKPNQRITSPRKTDGSDRGSGFSKPKAISSKVASSKNQVQPPTGFNKKLLVSLCSAASNKPEGSIKDVSIKNKSESSNHTPTSSEGLRAVATPIDRKKSAAGIREETVNTKTSPPVLIEDKNKKPDSSKSEVRTKTKTGGETRVKKPKESSKVSIKDLKLVGIPVKLPEGKTPSKPEEPEPEKVHLRIKIDVNPEEDYSLPGKNATDDGKDVCSFNWLFMSNKKYGEECEEQLNEKKTPEQQEIVMKEIIKEPAPPTPPLDDTFVESVKDELAASKELETGLEKHYRGSPVMKRRPRAKYKTPVIKVKNMKTRSNTGNRNHFLPKGRFNSAIHFQNKMNKSKADTKLRSGFTRSFNRDVNIGSETRDHFDDVNREKLKRRNSEPFSFRGFIWRHQDAVTLRDNKASVSSLGSSLKHLNTDDLEDFIFWESVPPRETSCWETSLYHFKRPWTVLSCSVFKDNRLSNTPGLILENIRNGNSITRRWPASQETERVSNSFDVEPSITQKNIDVRNWLAALNFQSPPSTSSDVIREGISSQTVAISQEPKTPIVQKRRKVFPALKLSESDEEKISKEADKYNTEGSDVALMGLIRRKSGGFVTAEQYFKLNRSQSFSSHEKSNPCDKSQVLEDLEDSDVEKLTESEIHVSKAEKMVQVALSDFVLPPSYPPVELMLNPSSRQDEEAIPPQTSPSLTLRKLLRGDSEVVTSNIWKYLFMFTLFVLVTYYVSRSKHSCRV